VNKIIAIAVFALLSSIGYSYAQLKIAYVDSDVILKQLPEAQEVQKQIEGLQKQYMDTINARETDLKTKYETFKTKYEDAQKQVEAGSLNPDQIKVLENEIGGLQTEIQKQDQELADYKQNVQQALLKTQNELFKPVKEKIDKAIEQVAKDNKYNMVLDKNTDTVLYGDRELDITFRVLEKLNLGK
jgi:outer membrane protein